jgi:hypothetical protein
MPDRPLMPTPVKTAVWLLSANLAIGLAQTILKPRPADYPYWFVVAFAFATGSVGAGLIFLVATGRRWAAIFFAVAFVVSLPITVTTVMRYLPDAPVSFALAAIQTHARAFALVLLFTSNARQWFRDCKLRA